MGQFEIIKTSERPNLVTPAKAGVQNKNLDSGLRRNDGETRHRRNLKFKLTHYPGFIAVAKIDDFFSAGTPEKSVGPGVPAGPDGKTVPARRPAPTKSKIWSL